jgi:cytochrome c oxidase subunit 3
LEIWVLPLINTFFLLLSGVTVTKAHGYILENDQKKFGYALFATILLGSIFLLSQ